MVSGWHFHASIVKCAFIIFTCITFFYSLFPTVPLLQLSIFEDFIFNNVYVSECGFVHLSVVPVEVKRGSPGAGRCELPDWSSGNWAQVFCNGSTCSSLGSVSPATSFLFFFLNLDYSFLSLLSSQSPSQLHFLPPTPQPLLLCFSPEKGKTPKNINQTWQIKLP